MPNVLAIPPTPPTTASPWLRVAWWIAGTVLDGVLINAFDYGDEIQPTSDSVEDPPAHTWRRIAVRCEDTLSAELADDQIFTFDVANYTNGQIDNTWTQGDYDQIAGSLALLLTPYGPLMPTRYRFVDWKSYIMAFNPYSNVKPFAISGAPEATGLLNVPGGSAGTMPPQASLSVTELTPSRANWGRYYLPGVSGTAIASTGRLTTTVVDAVAAAAEDFYESLTGGAQLVPVVPTTSVGKSPKRTLQWVTNIRVDDTIDVIRRRRHKHALYKKTLPTP